jgi:hypothetical protein
MPLTANAARCNCCSLQMPLTWFVQARRCRQRLPFPLKPAFALAINKSRGQTVDGRVGLYSQHHITAPHHSTMSQRTMSQHHITSSHHSTISQQAPYRMIISQHHITATPSQHQITAPSQHHVTAPHHSTITAPCRSTITAPCHNTSHCLLRLLLLLSLPPPPPLTSHCLLLLLSLPAPLALTACSSVGLCVECVRAVGGGGVCEGCEGHCCWCCGDVLKLYAIMPSSQ